MVELGLVTFTTFAFGTVVGVFVTMYKEYRSSRRTVDAKQRLYPLALASLGMIAATGTSISALIRFIDGHCA